MFATWARSALSLFTKAGIPYLPDDLQKEQQLIIVSLSCFQGVFVTQSAMRLVADCNQMCVQKCADSLSVQVMRSKLAPQTQPLSGSSVTSSADMLTRRHSMFAASLQQMYAAANEVHGLQQFVRSMLQAKT